MANDDVIYDPFSKNPEMQPCEHDVVYPKRFCAVCGIDEDEDDPPADGKEGGEEEPKDEEEE